MDSLLQQDFPELEIIVVDNGSTDGSPELVAARFPIVRLIRHERNLGFAAGNNTGLAAATGDVLALLNQDTLVRPNWLTQLVQGVTSDPHIGIGGCKILYPDQRTIQHAGGVIQYPLALPYHLGYRQPDDGRWDQQREMDFVTGAAIGFRRDVLEAIGPLDEGFYPAYYEDVDFCARARAAGYTVTYFPLATLIHLEATSIGWNSPTYLQHIHRGRMRYLLKHVSPRSFLEEVVPAERAKVHAMGSPEERLSLWRAYHTADLQLGELMETRRFVAASCQEWADHRSQIDAAFQTLREAAFQGAAVPQMLPGEEAELADFHHDRLRSALRHTRPTTLVNELIPAERARWARENPVAQEVLTELYRRLGPELSHLLPSAYPGETLLAEVFWQENLVNCSSTSSKGITELGGLRLRLQALELKTGLRHPIPDTGTPVIGSFRVFLRKLWYYAARRWPLPTLSNQQHAFNAEVIRALHDVAEFLIPLEETVIENDRAITMLKRRIADLERRLPADDQ